MKKNTHKKGPHTKSTKSSVTGLDKLGGIDELSGIDPKSRLKRFGARQNNWSKQISRNRSSIG
jgi:hypothetical protein